MNARHNGDRLSGARMEMVEKQLRQRGLRDDRVLAAMERVPRHAFVPAELESLAYSDGPLPIGEDQTISQPYIVAVMSESLGLEAGSRVLEIGTGSGYQTAVLAEMGLQVYTIEYRDRLARKAAALLRELGYRGIHYRTGDGHAGWPEAAPFQGILAAASPEAFPESLAGQLGSGGRLVLPVGARNQELRVYEKQPDGSLSMRALFPVRFVPLVRDPGYPPEGD